MRWKFVWKFLRTWKTRKTRLEILTRKGNSRLQQSKLRTMSWTGSRLPNWCFSIQLTHWIYFQKRSFGVSKLETHLKNHIFCFVGASKCIILVAVLWNFANWNTILIFDWCNLQFPFPVGISNRVFRVFQVRKNFHTHFHLMKLINKTRLQSINKKDSLSNL